MFYTHSFNFGAICSSLTQDYSRKDGRDPSLLQYIIEMPNDSIGLSIDHLEPLRHVLGQNHLRLVREF